MKTASPRPQAVPALAASAVGLRPAQEGAQAAGGVSRAKSLMTELKNLRYCNPYVFSLPRKALLNARGIARTGRIFDWLFNEPGHHTRNVG